jgi:hypothetical protein
MSNPDAIAQFLKEFHEKMQIWDVLYLNRDKNIQTLVDLELRPAERAKILEALQVQDYSEGPLPEKMMEGADMWVFGKSVKKQEVYIKITLGKFGSNVLCISFHIAEHKMNYPLK